MQLQFGCNGLLLDSKQHAVANLEFSIDLSLYMYTSAVVSVVLYEVPAYM